MELIATARFKKAMDRANAATSYTNRITQLVADLTKSGLSVSHPLLEPRPNPQRAKLLVLTANRGFCSGFNGTLLRAAFQRWQALQDEVGDVEVEVSGKKGIAGFKFRGIDTHKQFTQFEDKPSFDEVEEIASRYLHEYIAGHFDRLDVVYTKFVTISRQVLAVETLLPLGALDAGAPAAEGGGATLYEFLPSPESILEEVVPTSFKVKLFKCFLDSAVSEQIARMVAMKAATENAGELIKKLSMQYNRARQGRITAELMDLIGGVEALS